MKKSEFKCIGCIFGSGGLPKLVIKNLKKNNKKFVVVGIEADLPKLKEPYISASVGEIGKVLNFFKYNQVTDVVFIGKIKRPLFNEIKLDKSGALLLAKLGLKILKVLKGGDDYIISYVMQVFKKEGFNIIAPQELVPELLAPKGTLSKNSPSAQDKKDILVGRQVLDSLGSLDVGQAVIVEAGQVLGIEAAEGTDQLISRCTKLKKQTCSGVLIKMKKTKQETKTDLPAVGVQTVINVHKAGLNGIAFEAGKSLIADVDEVIAKANTLKIFLEGI